MNEALSLAIGFAIVGMAANGYHMVTHPKYGVMAYSRKRDLREFWYYAVRDPFYWTGYVLLVLHFVSIFALGAR